MIKTLPSVVVPVPSRLIAHLAPQNSFDSTYRDFDSSSRISDKGRSVWNETPRPFITSPQMIDSLKRNGVRVILDAACGDGRNLIPLAKAGFRVTGLDFSPEALGRCEVRCDYALFTGERSNVNLVPGRLEDVPRIFSVGEFDAVVWDFQSVHEADPSRIVDNFAYALRKGGFVLAEFMSTKDPHYGNGKQIMENVFIQGEKGKEQLIRLYTPKIIASLFEKHFEIKGFVRKLLLGSTTRGWIC